MPTPSPRARRTATIRGLLRLGIPAVVALGLAWNAARPGGSALTPVTAPPALDFEVALTAFIPGHALSDPILGRGSEGTPWIAGLAYEADHADRLLFGRVDPDAPRWEAVATGERQILNPAGLASADGAIHLVWTELHDTGPRLCWSMRRDERWSEPSELPTEGRALQPSLARTDDGRVWLAWQGGPDERGDDVFLGLLSDQGLTEQRRLDADAASDLDPQLAAVGNTLWLVWSRWQGREYEVLARSIQPDEPAASAPISVSRDPLADDVHPAVCADGDTLWVAWDALLDEERGASQHIGKPDDESEVEDMASVRVAAIQDGVVKRPPGHRGVPGLAVPVEQLSSNGGTPRLAVDAAGRVHLSYRSITEVAKGTRPQFRVAHRALSGAAWSEPALIADSLGRTRPVATLCEGEQLWIAYQIDEAAPAAPATSPPWPAGPVEDERRSAAGILLSHSLPRSSLVVQRSADPAAPPAAIPLVVAPQADEVVRPHHLPDPTHPIQSGREHHRVVVGDTEYKVYWGDLHRHSNYSFCSDGWEPSPTTRYDFGRDALGYDFYTLTEHSGQIDPAQWWHLGKLLDLYQTPRFVTMQGYEWSHALYGHQNVILRERLDRIVSPKISQMKTPRDLWEQLPVDAAITIPHHTAEVQMTYRWKWFDPRFLRLVEVFQACRGSYEFLGSYRPARFASATGSFAHDGLQAGCRFGIIASTDHGNGASYAAVLAEELERTAIFDALAARRCYGSTTKGMLLDVRVGDTLMGGELTTAEAPTLSVRVAGTAELAEVVVFRDGELAHAVGRERPIPRRDQEIVLDLDLASPRGQWPRNLPGFELEFSLDRGRFTPPPGRARDGPRRLGGQPFFELDSPEKGRCKAATWHYPEGSIGPTYDLLRRISLYAPAESVLSLRWPGGEAKVPVADLLLEAWSTTMKLSGAKNAKGTRMTLDVIGRIDLAVDTRKGLGDTEHAFEWTDPSSSQGESWYYVRAVQTDGEIAWSSPIFVTRE